jgi:hypothetical protein
VEIIMEKSILKAEANLIKAREILKEVGLNQYVKDVNQIIDKIDVFYIKKQIKEEINL